MSTTERPILDLDHLYLDCGLHVDADDGFCVMEAAAYLAGEPWSDHPKCVSVAIDGFLAAWNDTLDDYDRQRLKPYIPRIIGTNAPYAVELRRSYMALDWLVRQNVPAWLELAGHPRKAAALRALPELKDVASATAAVAKLGKAPHRWPDVRHLDQDAWHAAWHISGANSASCTQIAMNCYGADARAARAIDRSAAYAVARAVAEYTKDRPEAALSTTAYMLLDSAKDLLDRMIDYEHK